MARVDTFRLQHLGRRRVSSKDDTHRPMYSERVPAGGDDSLESQHYRVHIAPLADASRVYVQIDAVYQEEQ